MIAKPYAAVSALLVLGMFAVAAVIALRMPVALAANFARVALLFFIPALAALFWLLFAAVPWITPRGRNLFQSQSAYGAIWLAVTSMSAASFSVALGPVFHLAWAGPNLVHAASGIALIVIGNVSGKLRPNHFAGIRTPWTLADDEVWDKTHRFGGWIFVICGFVVLNAALIFDASATTRIATGATLATAIVVIGASWHFARQKRARLKGDNI
ncbi:MAG: SdpI family protein [Rhizomicrobium sp.]